MTRLTVMWGGLAAGLLMGASAIAGPLTPPGAPAPTMKTLDEVEPRIPLTQETAPGDADSVFRITQPGSYYLVGNIAVPGATSGVEIAVANVTLDLGGFTIAGVAGSLDGVQAASGLGAIVVRNGTVQDMGGEGVELLGEASAAEDLLALRNGGSGIRVLGQSSRVQRCAATNNGGTGIFVGPGGLVRDSTAGNNLFSGIDGNASSAIIGCVAYSNGVDGIRTGTQGLMADCSSRLNGGRGISTGFGATVRGCTSRDNTLAGFALGSASTLVDSAAYSNDGDGVTAGSMCTVESTTAAENGGVGIRVSEGVVRDCHVANNGLEGVIATAQSVVDRTHVARNGGVGIRLGGGENVIRRCTVVGNNLTLGGVQANDEVVDNIFLANP